jgi:hypothetical protein
MAKMETGIHINGTGMASQETGTESKETGMECKEAGIESTETGVNIYIFLYLQEFRNLLPIRLKKTNF